MLQILLRKRCRRKVTRGASGNSHPVGTKEGQKVLWYYEEQTEEEGTAEDRDQTFMEILNDLVPETRSLIAKHRAQV